MEKLAEAVQHRAYVALEVGYLCAEPGQKISQLSTAHDLMEQIDWQKLEAPYSELHYKIVNELSKLYQQTN